MHIGLTGGIGCGKTTVLAFFKRRGFPVFDSDEFCGNLYKNSGSDFIKKIKKKWAEKVFSGPLPDKKKIAAIVFRNLEERQWLNSIIHPMVIKEIRKKNKKNSLLMSDVPLLFEVGWEKKFDAVIAIWAAETLSFDRLIARGMMPQDAKARIKAQMSPERKMEKADFVLLNTGDKNFLYKQCSCLTKKIMEKNNEKI
jgi:dephospho-CoA kinase